MNRKWTWMLAAAVFMAVFAMAGNVIGTDESGSGTINGTIDGTVTGTVNGTINGTITGTITETKTTTAETVSGGQYGWLLAIGGGLFQLLLGIGMAVVAITLGLKVLKQILPEIKIWNEIQKGNLAVGILTAGVVIAYTKVISTGIKGMGDAVTFNPSLMGFVAGLLSVGIGIAFASLGVTWAFKVMSKLTKDIDESEELKKRNIAVGIFLAGVLYGVSEMIASAVSGIGKAIAAALGASGF